MADLDALIAQLHQRKMQIIMDMVVNHTGDEHEWFRQARSSRDNPFYLFYIWWPAEKGPPPYRRGFFRSGRRSLGIQCRDGFVVFALFQQTSTGPELGSCGDETGAL